MTQRLPSSLASLFRSLCSGLFPRSPPEALLFPFTDHTHRTGHASAIVRRVLSRKHSVVGPVNPELVVAGLAFRLTENRDFHSVWCGKSHDMVQAAELLAGSGISRSILTPICRRPTRRSVCFGCCWRTRNALVDLGRL